MADNNINNGINQTEIDIDALKSVIEEQRLSHKEFIDGVKKRAKDVEEKLQQVNLLQYYIYMIVDTLKQPTVIVDIEGNIVKENKAFTEDILDNSILEYRFPEIFFNPADKEEFENIFECCKCILMDDEYSLCDSLHGHEILEKCSSIDRDHMYWIGLGYEIKPYTLNITRIKVNNEENEHYFFITLNDMTYYVEQYNILRQAKDRYKRLAESTFEGLVFKTNDQIIDVNERLAEMLNMNKEDIIGKNPLDFIAPKFKEKVVNKMAEYVDDSNSHDSYYAHLIDGNGNSFPVEIKRKNSISENDNGSRIVAIRDLRDENQTENSLNALKIAFERSFDKIFICDDEKKVIWSNEALKHFYNIEEFHSLDYFLENEKTINLFNDTRRLEMSFESTEINVFNIELTSKEGKVMNSVVTVNPIINGISDEPKYWLFFQQTAIPKSPCITKG